MCQRPAAARPAAAPAALVVVESKLQLPVLHPEHVTRPRLLQQLEGARGRRLTLVDAPTGFGKSTLLAEWCRTAAVAGRVAWLALDAQDNDPVVFWTYLLHALRRVEPDRFAGCLAQLTAPGVSLLQQVLPQLLNALWSLPQPLVLVLDDYHTISDRACHASLAFVLGRQPPQLRLVIATRSDPPLPLARLRASGELYELRAADLAFADDEVGVLLNDALGLDLADADVATLTDRTEGWAAGLYLAALSLRGRTDGDRPAFIDAFAGDHRHLVAYLGDEVLARLPEDQRTFLAQTSVLAQLTPALCEAVTGTRGAAARLRELEQTNQFLIPLDQRGGWYRYHHLFQDLLQLELKRTQPALVSELHRRAAAWYRTAGEVVSAMRHALAAPDYDLAADLYVEHCFSLHQAGQLATLLRWADALPQATIAARPALAVVVAWFAAAAARPPAEVAHWRGLADTVDATGPAQNGLPSLRGAVALVQALYPFDDVGHALGAAQTAIAEATDPRTLAYIQTRMALGQCLYLAGRPAEARSVLETVLHAPLAARQSLGVIHALAHLAFASLAVGELAQADAYAGRAQELCGAQGLTGHLDTWLAALALSAVQVQYSRFEEAAATLATGVEPYLPLLRQWPIPYARALLELAPVRSARGQRQAAHELLAEARAVIAGCADPGMLREGLERLERQVQRVPRRTTGLTEALTDGELRVLRLLASGLSQRDIARELYVSVNTVKSHTRNIYAKLGTTSREVAVERARALGLIA
jgi:LuxR family maltose regulon positive regulatory protein